MSQDDWEDERDRIPEEEGDYDDYRRPAAPGGAVTAVGVINIVFGVLWGLCGACMMLLAGAFGLGGEELRRNPQVREAFREVPALEAIIVLVILGIAVFAILFAVLHLVAGIGVINRRNWARVLSLVLAGLALLLSCFGVLGFVQAVANPGGRQDPISSLVFLVVLLFYAIFSFVVLLNSNYAREFK